MEGLKILRAINALLLMENAGIISDWSVDRRTNIWSGYFRIGADVNVLYYATGNLLDTSEDSLLDKLGEIQDEYTEEEE